jgi:tellurite resistance protein TehA-like permease
MLQFETVITLIVMTVWLVLLAALYRRFRGQNVEPLLAGLAASAFAFGLQVIPGLVHTIAVVGSAINNDKPYDVRLAWLLTLGLILIHTGAVNMLLSGRIIPSARPSSCARRRQRCWLRF